MNTVSDEELYPDYFRLGEIIRPHGVKGEVILFVDSDEPEYYEQNILKRIFIPDGKNGRLTEKKIEGFNLLPSHIEAIIRLEGVNSRTEAELWCGLPYFLPAAELPPLDDEDDFYYHDVIGFEIQDQFLGNAGIITDFIELPAQDVFVVPTKGKQLWIPIIDEFISEIDFEQKIVYTTLPEGFEELF